GRGVRDVVVELRRPWYLEGWRLLAQWNQLIGRVRGIGKSNLAAVTRTNSRGEFRFGGLAPAQYYLRTDFTNEQDATPINLHAGASVNSVKVLAPDTGFRRVTGTVVDRTGAPIRFAQVALIRAGVVPLYQMGPIDSEPFQNGVFEIIVPGPGRYVLLAETPG